MTACTTTKTDVTKGRIESRNRLLDQVGARLSDPEAPVTQMSPRCGCLGLDLHATPQPDARHPSVRRRSERRTAGGEPVPADSAAQSPRSHNA
ncbi:MAG: hypothetical protein QOG22_451, partial [Pseudonocardiales bacterium]|nr:hypothetical protein [Pseudonocardiales bacterium]